MTTESSNIDGNKSNQKATQQIKVVGMLHFIGNIVSGGILGTILVVIYLIINNDLELKTKHSIYHIINFNISYFLYMILSFMLIIVFIGIPMLIFGFVLWCIILVIGFIKHLSGEEYKYPLSIPLLK